MPAAALPNVRPHAPVRRAGGSFYRPELDVLRFIAFLLVFLHHTLPRQGAVPHLGPQMSALVTSFAKACGFGLCLFFALSAFLITELLVREKDTCGKLEIKAFYIRRALRIWPLYFLGLAIGVTVALLKPVPGVLERYTAYAFLAGNWYCLAHIAGAGNSPMEILWSISVEEQFYLFWPWVAAKARKALKIAALGLLAVSAAALIVTAKIGANTEAAWFNSFVQFGMFGAGAILSLRLRGRLLQWGIVLRSMAAFSAITLWFMASYLFHIKDPGPVTSGFKLLAGYTFVEIGCVLILLAIMGVSRAMLPRFLIYLGRISFGLYVFHVLSLHIAWNILRALHASHAGMIEPLLGLAITIAFASLSYRYYETPFLKLKKRLEVVQSRPV